MFHWVDPDDDSAKGSIDWAAVHKVKDMCPRCKEDGKIVELIEKISEYCQGAIKKCPQCGWC